MILRQMLHRLMIRLGIKKEKKKNVDRSWSTVPFPLLDKMQSDLDPTLNDGAHAALRKLHWQWNGVDLDNEPK